MRRVWAWLAVLAMLALMGAGEALARSVALVIGNSVYRHAPPLDNPLNDARDVAASLKRLGFDVTILADADYTAMRRGLAAFQAKAAGADVALLYYAGHGVGVDGQSWLVPVDAKLARQEAVELEAISLRQALSAVGGARRLRLVVLDACRDDPFSRRMRAMRGSRRIARGLARIEPAGDTMVWYAAKDGSTASDGDGRNSPFSAAFLKHIERPGLELGKLFREIVGDVRDATKGDQIPWAYGTRGRDDFFFKRAAAAPPPPKTAAPSALERDRVAFELAMSIEDPKSRAAALRAFLKRYPRSSLRRSAESALKTAMKSVAMAPTKPAAAETSSRFEARLRAAGKKGAKECAACPEMVAIPAGSFLMGSPETELKRRKYEGPQRRVAIKAFAIGKYEITFEQWDRCAAEGYCRSNPKPRDQGWGRGKRPVIGVSWDDITGAGGFLDWLNSKVPGSPYRLPSEAEWEYAARAGTVGPFSFKGKISADKANYDADYRYAGSPQGAWRKKTLPVGTFAANPWGLHDVHGNVSEWVQDCVHSSYRGAPADGAPWMAADEGLCSSAIIRGGSWSNYPKYLRSAFRSWIHRYGRYRGTGFRVARTIIPS